MLFSRVIFNRRISSCHKEDRHEARFSFRSINVPLMLLKSADIRPLLLGNSIFPPTPVIRGNSFVRASNKRTRHTYSRGTYRDPDGTIPRGNSRHSWNSRCCSTAHRPIHTRKIQPININMAAPLDLHASYRTKRLSVMVDL